MDLSSKSLEPLESLRQFLRAEGLYATAEALTSEMKNRYPSRNSPTNSVQRAAQADELSQRVSAYEHKAKHQSLQGHSPSESSRVNSGDIEGWREGQNAFTGHDEHGNFDQLYNHYQEAAESQAKNWKRSSQQPHDMATDEYDSEEDLGYVREPIRWQSAFQSQELRQDDSRDAMRLYHQAKASQDGSGRYHEAGSSHEHDSSYIPAVSNHASTTPHSHASNSSRDRGEDERVVTLVEPVNAKATPPPPETYIVPPQSLSPPAAEESPPQTPQRQITSSASLYTPSTGPDGHPLSHISSEFSIDSPLYHEPSLSANMGKVGEESDEGQARNEGGWGRGYFDPFGVIGKVFGRRSSAGPAEDEQSKAGPPARGSKAVQSLDFGQAIASPPLVREEGPRIAEEFVGETGEIDQAKISVDTADNNSDTVEASAGELDHQIPDQAIPAAPEGDNATSSDAPETPKAAEKDDDGAVFSFPVTPASGPPAAAEPGSVFKTWPSFRKEGKSSSRQCSQGDPSRESSEYAASTGYSTDDGTPLGKSSREWGGQHSQAGSQSDLLAHNADYTQEETSNASTSPKRNAGSAQDEALQLQKKSPLALLPLDSSVSLPPKATNLVLGNSTDEESERVDTLQAYQPIREGVEGQAAEDLSTASGEMTVRTMENGGPAGTEGSTARASIADDNSSVTYRWDEDYLHRRYEVLNLKIVHPRYKTGFEESKDIVFRRDDLVAGRYQVTASLGSAAFSQAVQAIDIKTGGLVCLKVIKNNKDYMDQSLDEIKLLKYVNEHDPEDEHGILQLYDYFYYKEHLFLVCELLRANLYEFQRHNRDQGQEPYFTLPKVQSIARQVLKSLAFMHSLDLIHCDLKPENILIKSFSKCEVKVIDLGSSCFTTDSMSSYVQSRSYRAPEVILGLPYHQTVDIWSLGCILAELLSGEVLFQNESLGTLLARLEGILGPVPDNMLQEGCYTHRYYTVNGALYEQNEKTGRYEYLRPRRTSLKHQVPEADEGCLDFMSCLLSTDPKKRPSAVEALQHPWLQHDYERMQPLSIPSLY